MNFTELKIGTKLELEIVNGDGVKLDHNLVSEFEWSTGETTAMIAAPIFEGNIYPIRMGMVMNIYFLKKSNDLTELYRFKARVTGRGTSENIALLNIVTESGFEKVQRREFFRLECSLAINFRVVDTFNDSVNEEFKFNKSITSNISGGGLCLLLEDKLERGMIVECRINTAPNKVLKLYGKVVICEKRETEGKYKYKAGINYTKIEYRDREDIVKYIFREQRKLRKKGLI